MPLYGIDIVAGFRISAADYWIVVAELSLTGELDRQYARHGALWDQVCDLCAKGHSRGLEPAPRLST